MSPDLQTLDTPVWIESPAETERPITGRRPPKDGPCKRCGENRPLNRLFLCYPCWVKTELEKSGWREGEPHPGGCGCEMVSDHTSNGPRG